MGQEELRDRLCGILDRGLAAAAISKRTGITQDALSKFKNGKVYLIPEDVRKLEEYLGQVVLPE